MRDYRKLTVWQKGHTLALRVYEVTRGFPKEEIYGLTSQMRRAASSIPMNLAEGRGRESADDFARFVQMAAGSSNELEYQLLLTRDLRILRPTDYESLKEDVVEVRRMLTALWKTLKSAK